ncbi:uncharacterized protein EI90DRAFT_3154039 [Cantharellus anzutake]|uniref:uncharacterized protein n=1 Tax=Cantharellus anzutake TaxID=1750568 RepID=UPI0019068DE1|nr:uncharacterized protein EI90DRAFT_3154039 [Cantharellus anzutake]KAF8332691.1 hypothetical protein EI90DRAFT_3154039 [Cantharellus anzutake]
MVKRAALKQGGADTGTEEDEEAQDIPTFNSNPEEIAKRQIKGLPRRSRSSAAPASTQVTSLGTKSQPTLLFGSAANPVTVSQFKFSPASTAPTIAPTSFASFTPPSNLSIKYDTQLTFYSSMRGLNHSLLKSLQEVMTTDPFVDMRPILQEALTKYTSHQASIQKENDRKEGPEKPPTTESTAVESAKPPIPMTSPPTAGFLFGGKPVPIVSGPEKSKKDAGGFIFKPPTGSAPPASTNIFSAFAKSASPAPVFLPPSVAPDTGAEEDSTILQPTPPVPMENVASGDSDESADVPDNAKQPPKPVPSFPTQAFSTPAFGTASFGTTAFGSSGGAFSFGSNSKTFQPQRAGGKTEEGDNSTAPSSGAAPSAFPTINDKADNASPNVSGASINGSPEPIPGKATGEDSDPSTTSVLPAQGFGGASKGLTFSASSSSPFSGTSNPSSSFGAFSGTGSAFAFKPSKDDEPSDNSSTTSFKFGVTSKPSVFGTSSFGAPLPSAAPQTKNPISFGSSPKPFGNSVGFGFGMHLKETKPQESAIPPADAVTSPAEPAEGADTEGEALTGADPFAHDPSSSGDADTEGEGEENETASYTGRSKLLKFVDGAWKTCGVGFFKVKKNKESGKQRVLFRLEGSKKVAANFNVYPAMKVTPNKTAMSFGGFEGSNLVPYGLRFASVEMREEAQKALENAILEL